MTVGKLGLYVHVPFCRTRCRYCDFYRVGENAEKIELFLRAFQREVAATGPVQRPVDSVFLGGGTPSLLTPEQVRGVLGTLSSRFDLEPGCEVSIECNPSDLSPERLAEYRASGATRVSIGVQSFCDRELELLGRRHDALRAEASTRWARQAGFERISIDLMLGIPGQTAASFRRSAERAVQLDIDHLSVYLLEVHPGSEIDGLRRKRPGLFPSDEAQCRRYEWLAECCAAAGLEHYEISNFAREGGQSRHNLKYWRRQDYLGFGPSAHSCLGDRRWSRPRDLAAYLKDPTIEQPEESNRAEERLFLALRLAEGAAVGEIARSLNLGIDRCRDRLEGLAPFLEVRDDRARFSIRGFLVSNSVLTEILGWQRGDPGALFEAAALHG